MSTLASAPIPLADPTGGTLLAVCNTDQGHLTLVVHVGAKPFSLRLDAPAWRVLSGAIAKSPAPDFTPAARSCRCCHTTAPAGGWAFRNLCNACAP